MMTDPAFSSVRYWLLISLVGVLIFGDGCRKQSSDFFITSVQGQIEHVDVTTQRTGTITVRYEPAHSARPTSAKALVTRETEILIHGVLGTIHNLHEGDRIRAQIRVERNAGTTRYLVLKIRVDTT